MPLSIWLSRNSRSNNKLGGRNGKWTKRRLGGTIDKTACEGEGEVRRGRGGGLAGLGGLFLRACIVGNNIYNLVIKYIIFLSFGIIFGLKSKSHNTHHPVEKNKENNNPVKEKENDKRSPVVRVGIFAIFCVYLFKMMEVVVGVNRNFYSIFFCF